jgi:type IV secretion system protein VirD4
MTIRGVADVGHAEVHFCERVAMSTKKPQIRNRGDAAEALFRNEETKVASPALLPVGWSSDCIATPKRKIGFHSVAPLPAKTLVEILTYAGDGHLMTLAPTGAGKGRSATIPALLKYPGATLTIDLKGEAYHVTARRRREMGHRVVKLDPFEILGPDSDCLNPMGLFDLPGGAADVDSEHLAELLAGGQPICSDDLFWEKNGKGMLVGLIGLANEEDDPEKRNVAQVLDYLYDDDVEYGIAQKLEDHKFHNTLARQELVAYLQHESEKCRPSVRSTAQCMVKCLGAESIRKFLSKTTFDLMGLLRGEAIDIYFVFPPDKLDSHKPLLRLVLGTLLTVLSRRTEIPPVRSLLLLDEIAQCGTLAHLRTALTLLRGYGVQVWCMWQDLSQLKQLYPHDWETILNNSAVIQAFGVTNGWAAKAVAEIMDMTPTEILTMGRMRQALLRPGKGAIITRRVDYLDDEDFKGLYDPNPRYRGRG